MTAGTLVHHGLRPRTERLAPAVLLIAIGVALAFLAVGLQAMRLALVGHPSGPISKAQIAEPLARFYSRPDIVDAKGRLIATDLKAYSLFADPVQVHDVDETSERLAELFADLKATDLRQSLSDRSRRFVWIKRGLSPTLAQRIHDWGMPGLGFREEPKRAYPQGRLGGLVIGGVSVDNRGLGGIEKHIDDTLGLETGYAIDFARPPVALTLDVGVQHALEEELSLAMAQYGASGAAGVIMDARTGAVKAAASLPDVDPSRPGEALLGDRTDRLGAATYELGSVLKAFTAAMALELGLVEPGTVIDVRVPVQAGGWTIRDPGPSGRPLTVREIVTQSSNVGSARLALMAGAARQRAFLAKVGITDPLRWEVGPIGPVRLPARWGEAETATIAYGYGLAVSPLQLAAAAGALVNGGLRVRPHVIEALGDRPMATRPEERVISAQTSARISEILRRAVTSPGGTGHRANAAGYEVGGKTGTAEMSAQGGYRARSVVASFLGAFPMSQPAYVVLVTLVEPRPDQGPGGRITAGVNAAPVAGRLIARTAPMLGVIPR